MSNGASSPPTIIDPTKSIIRLSAREVEDAISSFRSLLKYPTISSLASHDGSYVACAEYLLTTLRSVPCLEDARILDESEPNSLVVVAKWTGVHEDWPVILLNSHYDVVPVIVDDWTVDPFSAVRRDGRIYGRGAQDMKCVCVQYVEAIWKIHNVDPNYRPMRTIHLTFVPDEEVGGSGMQAFLSSSLYGSIPGIALALDEGLASTDGTYSLFYGERLPWWVDVTATGRTGHASRFVESTAVEQLIGVANRALAYRDGQQNLLHGTTTTTTTTSGTASESSSSSSAADHSNCSHAVAAKRMKRMQRSREGGRVALGDVTSLNITTLEAGVRVGDTYAYNCVPPIARCTFDIRISPHVDPREIGNMIDGWCRECSSSSSSSSGGAGGDGGYDVKWKGVGTGDVTYDHALTTVDGTNPWYRVFVDALSGIGHEVVPQVFPAATDSRFLRQLGIRAFGFSPMRNTEIMLHENDEYLEESVFVEGIEVYVCLIAALGSVTDIDNVANVSSTRVTDTRDDR